MKRFNYIYVFGFMLLILAEATPNARAQYNIDYRRLTMTHHRQSIFFDFMVLPGKTDSTVTFASVFSLSYKFLPFKKRNSADADQSFYSPANLSMEVFNSNKSNLEKHKNVSVDGLKSVGRAFWEDTAYAASYDETKSEKEFLSGQISESLSPGIYSYVLQMKRGEESESKASRVKTVRIQAYDKMKTGNIILGESINNKDGKKKMKLLSLGDQVPYGKDFYALAYIPSFNANASYTCHINRINIADKDTTKENEVYTTSISQKDLQASIHPALSSSDKKGIYLDLSSSQNGFAYALLKIPNSKFENAVYRLSINKDGNQKSVAKTVFRSNWIDIPTSLLSLDVSIDMLHYIVDKSTLKKISSGSKSEREEKFRAFWKKRDPTPNTVYNELMAEYYRRIDYAYRNFSSESLAGYNTDQGTIYIKYGPPKDIERKFPANSPTVEVWTYPTRKFVFKATSGFGDFKLVPDQ